MADKKTHFVRAGEYYGMSELLLRGWNVAVPVVDVGDDVFVIEMLLIRVDASWRFLVIPRTSLLEIRNAYVVAGADRQGPAGVRSATTPRRRTDFRSRWCCGVRTRRLGERRSRHTSIGGPRRSLP
jgi:hypothetical protein